MLISGGGTASVSGCEIEPQVDSVTVIIKIFCNDGAHRKPRSASGPHLVELAYHCGTLIPQNCDCLICLSGRAAHLDQLIIHDSRLSKVYARLDASDYE